MAVIPLRTLGENLPIPGPGLRWAIGAAVGVLSFIVGSAMTLQVSRDNASAAAAHQVEFEKAVWTRFDAEISTRNERLAALDKAANGRMDALNTKLDQAAAALSGRIERLDKLAEQRGERLGAIENRITTLEVKLCALGGVRISGCK